MAAHISAQRIVRPAENHRTSDRPQEAKILSACAGSPYAENARVRGGDAGGGGEGGEGGDIVDVPDTR
ncbi:hypothetical protein Psi01_18270 [Planobispora siamensis]|uniref:Uncharacterized protein n=1 Tax=Planobispora siamensis TaxID=936338 RepID=A0A8J3SE55_9ACTN|nr:hypothetical protein Psi01_18270 [Planobispora siamensis]